MKYLSLLFVLVGFGVSAQSLRVVHVSGEIYSSKEGRNLKLGDYLASDDKLSYKSGKNACLLFDGKQKMSFRQSGGASSGTVSDLFQTTQDRQLIASRGDNDSAFIDLEDYFIGDEYLLVGDEEKIQLNPGYYKNLKDCKFLFVDDQNKKTEMKLEGNTLSLERAALLEQFQHERKGAIYVVNVKTQEFNKEVEFTLHGPDQRALADQTKYFLEMMDGEDTETQVGETYKMMQEIYGHLSFPYWYDFVANNVKK